MNILKKNNILIIVYDCLYIINISKVVCSIIGMTEYFIVMTTIIYMYIVNINVYNKLLSQKWGVQVTL